jgi:hypothetical protein
MIEYHAGDSGLKRGDGRVAANLEYVTKTAPREIDCRSWEAAQSEHLPTPSPLTHLSADRTDPFASFARTINQTEQFLFDFCTFKRAVTRILRWPFDLLSVN